jgi:hypothetical protein
VKFSLFLLSINEFSCFLIYSKKQTHFFQNNENKNIRVRLQTIKEKRDYLKKLNNGLANTIAANTNN